MPNSYTLSCPSRPAIVGNGSANDACARLPNYHTPVLTKATTWPLMGLTGLLNRVAVVEKLQTTQRKSSPGPWSGWRSCRGGNRRGNRGWRTGIDPAARQPGTSGGDLGWGRGPSPGHRGGCGPLHRPGTVRARSRNTRSRRATIRRSAECFSRAAALELMQGRAACAR